MNKYLYSTFFFECVAMEVDQMRKRQASKHTWLSGSNGHYKVSLRLLDPSSPSFFFPLIHD